MEVVLVEISAPEVPKNIFPGSNRFFKINYTLDFVEVY
jgi:hypothetical protein